MIVSRIGKLRFNRAGLVNLVVIRQIELCSGRLGAVSRIW